MTDATAGELEAPSGKGAGDENFPVGSRLIAPALRPHVMAFYAFARAADDIADSGELSRDEKLRRLNLFDAALVRDLPAPAKAARLRQSLALTGVSDAHPRRLLEAFKLDAVKSRYASWQELADYCALSAHPVGRYLLDLHGEGPATHEPSDALTAALQVLNHLQDIRNDYLRMNRIYLPADWMADEGVAEADLDRSAATPGLRRVIDRCLDGCDGWLGMAAPLPRLIRNRRLAAEAAVILTLGRRLSLRLRTGDPLARRVVLRRTDWARGAAAGLRRLMAA